MFERTFTRTILIVTLVLNLAVFGQIVVMSIQANLLSRVLDANRLPVLFAYVIGMSALILAIIVEVYLLLKSRRQDRQAVFSTPTVFDSFATRLQRLGRWNYALFGLCIGLYAYIIIYNPLLQHLPGQYARYIDTYLLRIFLFWLLSLAGMILMRAAGTSRRNPPAVKDTATVNTTPGGWSTYLAASLIIAATGFAIASFLPNLTNYPFSLDWSETSRYYYASLYRSKALYGLSVPPTVLHPSRYLLQALPFLIPEAPIIIHRLWQDILWFVATFLTAYLLARRLKALEKGLLWWIFILWACLYLVMAPVYYHLLITIILVLWGFNRNKPWQTLLVVLLASAWAGISRINWFPVPGLLAAVLFFLEVAVQPKTVMRYLLRPALWVGLGTLTAFAAQAAYVVWSGNPSEQFSSSLSSDLLWYRLLPNATYPMGILLSVILVVFPEILILIGSLRSGGRAYHWIRLLGLGSVLFVLFVGGIIVSVKIGGGSNLHNMDAFLALLLVATGYCLFGDVAHEPVAHAAAQPYRPPVIVIALAIIIPVLFILQASAAPALPDKNEVAQSLLTIQEAVDQAVQNDGKVLFISERQLIMFDNITGVSLVPDYEKVFLMEMAMSDNRTYLETFYHNLKNHQYALIVSEPIKVSYQDRSDSFGEENNAWVDRVAKQILCYYEPVKTMKSVRTQLLTPRGQPGDCD